MIQATGSRAMNLLLAIPLIGLTAVGCSTAPRLYFSAEHEPVRALRLSEAWYVSDNGGYRVLGVIHSRPSAVRFLTLGKVKDADSATYYIEMNIPEGLADADVSVVVAAWGGARLMKGQCPKEVTLLGKKELLLACSGTILTHAGDPVQTATFRLTGRVRASSRGFAKLLAGYEMEKSRLLEAGSL